MMGMPVRSLAVSLAVGALLVFVLFHLIIALPLWLLVGGLVLALWLRSGSHRGGFLGWGRAGTRRLRSRW